MRELARARAERDAIKARIPPMYQTGPYAGIKFVEERAVKLVEDKLSAEKEAHEATKSRNQSKIDRQTNAYRKLAAERDAFADEIRKLRGAATSNDTQVALIAELRAQLANVNKPHQEALRIEIVARNTAETRAKNAESAINYWKTLADNRYKSLNQEVDAHSKTKSDYVKLRKNVLQTSKDYATQLANLDPEQGIEFRGVDRLPKPAELDPSKGPYFWERVPRPGIYGW